MSNSDQLDKLIAGLEILKTYKYTAAPQNSKPLSTCPNGLMVPEVRYSDVSVPDQATLATNGWRVHPLYGCYWKPIDVNPADGWDPGQGGGGDTDLSQGTRTATTVEVDSSTGSSAVLTAATTTLAGVMTAADKSKLNSLTPAQVQTVTATLPITSSGGFNPNIAINPATTTSAGSMSADDKIKLAGLSNYVHPAGDGYHHVPATGSSNNGKVLTAGSFPGSEAWVELPVITSVDVAVACLSTDLPGDVMRIRGAMSGGVWTVGKVDCLNRLKMPGVGILLSKSTPTTGVMRRVGLIENLYSGMTVTGKTFIGRTGRLVHTAPSPGVGEIVYVQRMGIVLDTAVLYLTGETGEVYTRIG